MKTVPVWLLALAFVHTFAHAQQDASGASTDPMQSEAGAELRSAPPVYAGPVPRTQNDVTWLCGGIGEEEAAFMKGSAKDYDMMLTFAARDGAYLADVDVTIADAKGNAVLEANCDGPLMLVDLPASGSYRVHAETAGHARDRTVHVIAPERKGRHLAAAVMTWPAAATQTGTSVGSSGSAEIGSGK